MSFGKMFNIWTAYPPLNGVIWFVLIVCVLYFARSLAHKAIKSFCEVLHDGLQMMAKSALRAEERVAERNREVLFTTGKEAVEKVIEREFHRVDTVVKRDLSGFPVLKRSLSDQIIRIDEDYQQSSEVQPPPPEWVNAVDAMSKISLKNNGNQAVADILSEIHKSTMNQYKTAMEEYRKAVAERHTTLNKLMPYWRRLTQTLDEVGKTITGLHERSAQIDARMDEYENIRSKTDNAERMLTSSSTTQFFISGLVLLIAIGGAIINFNLIALPMSEMVGGGSYIGMFKTSNVAALIIILVEVAMGLYLMESLRITRLFPIIGQLDDKMRVKMIWITFSILVILAGIESSLALMRDQIAANNQALLQTLAGGEISKPQYNWIPMVGQMVMGFILPFVLTFVAIPLESFVQSSRTVIGILATSFLRVLAFSLQLFGNIINHLGEFITNIYDIMIFPFLWTEALLRGDKPGKNNIDTDEGSVIAEANADMDFENVQQVVAEHQDVNQQVDKAEVAV